METAPASPVPVASPPDAVAGAGRVVGDYRLERRIGRGAMGEVWLGRHQRTKGLAAVKVLREDSPRARDRMKKFFARERRAIARLSHPHIVQLFEIGHDFLVTRYVDGANLARRLATPVEPERALDITLQIAAALAHAHRNRVIHRDVKPSNILIDSLGNAYLADFGLAAILDDADANAPEARGGTPQYMAPEQARGAPAGPLADQYSLGRVLAEMLAGGRVPPGADDAIAALPVTLPRALAEAVRRAIDPDPAARWPSLEEFAAALEVIDVRAAPAPSRLLPEVRVKTPFAWAPACEATRHVTPAIVRADYRLSKLEEAGAISREAGRAFRDRTGYADFGWAVIGRSDRLGAITDPAAWARAGEIVVMIHGGLCTRESWVDVAAHTAQGNAQTLVLVPDVSGYGVSRFQKRWPDKQHVSAAAIRDGVLAWLELLGVRELPMVLVGHSLGAVALLTATDEAYGPRTSRVAVGPVFPAVDRQQRFLLRVLPLVVLGLAWIPGVKRLLGKLALIWSSAARAYSRPERQRMFDTYMRLPLPTLVRASRAFSRALPAPGDRMARCMVILAEGDPVAPIDRMLRALRLLNFPEANIHRLVADGHLPHGEAEAHPEWTRRNIFEITAIIDQLLIAAREGSVLPTQVASTLMSDGSSTQSATPASGPGLAKGSTELPGSRPG